MHADVGVMHTPEYHGIYNAVGKFMIAVGIVLKLYER